MAFSPNAETVYADGPFGSPLQPSKPEIRSLLAQYEAAIDAYSSGAGSIAKSTRALLFADLAHAADVTAWVYADSTVAYNGIYRKSGASGVGSWSLILPLPFSFIIASDAGAGTANAIQATTSIPVSGSALVWMNVFEANTASPVTVSFNGGTALTIKSNSGTDIAAGGFVAGMIVMGVVSGSTFRLVSDQASSAIVAAAQAAQAAAEAAAVSVNIKNVADRTALKALNTAVTTLAFVQGASGGHFQWTSGNFSTQIAGDTQEGLYIKADAISASAGAWVRQAGFALEGVKPEWFGARADGSTDCRAAIQAGLNTGYNLHLGFGTYRTNGPILVRTTGQQLVGAGMGYGYGNPSTALKDYVPQTRLQARGTFARRIMTRRKARTTSGDAQDSTLSAVVELHADGAKVRDIQVDLYCDYTNVSHINLGDEVDIGVFVGCRVGVQLHNVAVTGYFRKVGVYWDVTRDPVQLPELLDPDGNALPAGASGASFRGGDGSQVWNLYVRGARVAEAILGAINTGGNYYDQLLGAAVPDRRGASGFSDFNMYGGRLYPGGHHSGRRLADPIASPLTRSNLEAEDDFAPAALYIDGWAQNSSSTTHGIGAIRGFVFHAVRFASPEIFRVRLGTCDEIYFSGRAWSENGTNGAAFANTAGITVDTNDYVNYTYGHFCTHSTKTGSIDIAALAGGIYQPWIHANTKFTGRQSDGSVKERYAIAGQIDLADDTVLTITPPALGGWMHVTKSPANAPIFNQSALFYFDAGASLDIQSTHIGANVTLGTTDLTDGTSNGVDGNLCVSVQAGVIKVKNRTGSQGLWRYRFL